MTFTFNLTDELAQGGQGAIFGLPAAAFVAAAASQAGGGAAQIWTLQRFELGPGYSPVGETDIFVC